MDIETAKNQILSGASFGDVFPELSPRDNEQFKKWYTDDPRVPVHRTRPVPTSQSENLCRQCGGFLVRTGTCETCQSCGSSTGGCG